VPIKQTSTFKYAAVISGECIEYAYTSCYQSRSVVHLNATGNDRAILLIYVIITKSNAQKQNKNIGR
jgi:hypothetical protein